MYVDSHFSHLVKSYDMIRYLLLESHFQRFTCKDHFLFYWIIETMEAPLLSNLSIYIGSIQLKSVSIYFDLRADGCNLDIEISLHLMKF